MRPQRFCLFLVVFLLYYSKNIFGQVSPAPATDSASSATAKNQLITGGSQPIPYYRITTSTFPVVSKFSVTGISPAYYANHLGFVCKTELKLDKITPLPFRFRLGSLEYVNWMEQKPNVIKPR